MGDSPIIGAGLYVDNSVGAATSTGNGEEVIRCSGSFLVVEYMRLGLHPTEACKKACERLLAMTPNSTDKIQIGFIAINKKGEYGADPPAGKIQSCHQRTFGTRPPPWCSRPYR